MKKDITVLGKGKSDPYAILTVGAQTFRTQTIDNTVDPKWDYWCEVSGRWDGVLLFSLLAVFECVCLCGSDFTFYRSVLAKFIRETFVRDSILCNNFVRFLFTINYMIAEKEACGLNQNKRQNT